jgi:hypothetical protein
VVGTELLELLALLVGGSCRDHSGTGGFCKLSNKKQ